MRKESLRKACESIVSDVDSVRACVLMDLDTGLPLALETKPAHMGADAIELLAAAGASYFNEHGTSDDGINLVEEVQTTTDDSYVFMSRVPGRANELLVLVTSRVMTNLGLGWMSMRQALAEVRDAGLYEDEDAPAVDGPDRDRRLGEQDNIFNVRSHRGRRSVWD